MKASLLHTAAICLIALAGEARSDTTDTAAAARSSKDPNWVSNLGFKNAILATTNGYRGQHGAYDVTWSETLSHYAADYLNENNCVFQHSGGDYGENIAYGYSSPATTIQAFGDERRYYDFNNPGYSSATGHFTQLVWKSTTEVGCGRRWCGNSMGWYLVCEYSPPGNYIGEFAENVGRRQ